MTDTERGLLQAIHDDPDDDAVRLVYADYLEERGDPRGEFIRLQVMKAGNKRALESVAREDALLQQYGDEWTRIAQPFNPGKIRFGFQRGFIESVTIHKGTVADYAVLLRLPGVLKLQLCNSRLSQSGLRSIVSLKQLRKLDFYESPLNAAGLAMLEALPCWTRIQYSNGYPDAVTWAAVQTRRVSKFFELSPPQRRQAALRFLRALSPPQNSLTHIDLHDTLIDDWEVPIFAEFPELEAINLTQCYSLSVAGLRHLAQLPNLNSVRLGNTSANCLGPLSACTTLETLQLGTARGTLTDAGTEGLERLTNLRVLELWGRNLTDVTIDRLRPLRQLRELTLAGVAVTKFNSLAAISGHLGLESVSINERQQYLHEPSGLGKRDLRHFSSLTRLHTLKLSLRNGTGEEFHYLSGLHALRLLQLRGPGLTDLGLRQLAALQNLQTISAVDSVVTEAGARWLAEHLPGATVVTRDFVVKSPRQSIRFRRFGRAGWASVLLPTHWYRLPGYELSLVEDGCDNIDHWPGFVQPAPARLHFLALEEDGAQSAKKRLREAVVTAGRRHPHFVGHDVVHWSSWESASCLYINQGRQCLSCVAVQGLRSVILDCDAPTTRFESFRALFLFVARSVRLGNDASLGIDEVIEVPTAEIERLAATDSPH